MALRKAKVVKVGEELERLFDSLNFIPTGDAQEAIVNRIKEIIEDLK